MPDLDLMHDALVHDGSYIALHLAPFLQTEALTCRRLLFSNVFLK
jgi:hypothetical protein